MTVAEPPFDLSVSAPLSPIEKLAAVPLTRDDVELIVRTWQKRLQLDYWRLTIDFDTPPSKSGSDEDVPEAEIYASTPYDHAKLLLNPDWKTWDRLWANLTVVHELMHMHSRDLRAACTSVGDVLTHQAKLLWTSRCEHEEEKLVDKMATLLVSLGGVV